ALAEVRSDLAAQTDRLEQMQASFPDSPSLDASIKDDVTAAASAAAKANTLAADLKLGASVQANIIALGKKATAALDYLQSLSKTQATTVALNDAALNAVELVDAYTKELSDYVASLNPTDSGLSAGQIAAYEAQAVAIVAQVNATEDSLVSIDSTPVSVVAAGDSNPSQPGSNPESGIAPVSPSAPPGSNPASDAASSSPAQSQGSGQTSNPASSGTGTITLGDIVSQEDVVAQASQEVDQLTNQTAAENPPASGGSTDASSPDSSSGQSSSDNSGDTGATGGNDNGGNPIQTSNGPVKLIQGENTF
ncbi:MAG: hypothetical protein P4L61_04215, partial [Candidatus Pacebacteria bacterium]|nr:hypothetical protein [Candidatus Paceibacterota bacterium]